MMEKLIIKYNTRIKVNDVLHYVERSMEVIKNSDGGDIIEHMTFDGDIQVTTELTELGTKVITVGKEI